MENKIECPNCGQEIDVNEILYHQLQDEIKKEYSEKLVEQKKQYEVKVLALNKDKEKIEKEKEKIQEQINSGIVE